MLCLLFAGCAAVTVPDTAFYRLAVPRAKPAPSPAAETVSRSKLRLGTGTLRLAAGLATDRLMATEGPVRARFFHYHRWAGPLDRLLEDAMVLGLRRREQFAEVLREPLPGCVDCVLHAEVQRFGVAVEDGSWFGDVAMQLRLEGPDGLRLFEAEFERREPAASSDPAAAVAALSTALSGVVADFEAACAALLPLRDPGIPAVDLDLRSATQPPR